jgi:hypothetical protein
MSKSKGDFPEVIWSVTGSGTQSPPPCCSTCTWAFTNKVTSKFKMGTPPLVDTSSLLEYEGEREEVSFSHFAYIYWLKLKSRDHSYKEELEKEYLYLMTTCLKFSCFILMKKGKVYSRVKEKCLPLWTYSRFPIFYYYNAMRYSRRYLSVFM